MYSSAEVCPNIYKAPSKQLPFVNRCTANCLSAWKQCVPSITSNGTQILESAFRSGLKRPFWLCWKFGSVWLVKNCWRLHSLRLNGTKDQKNHQSRFHLKSVTLQKICHIFLDKGLLNVRNYISTYETTTPMFINKITPWGKTCEINFWGEPPSYFILKGGLYKCI